MYGSCNTRKRRRDGGDGGGRESLEQKDKATVREERQIRKEKEK
jgi:hypothetical protein